MLPEATPVEGAESMSIEDRLVAKMEASEGPAETDQGTDDDQNLAEERDEDIIDSEKDDSTDEDDASDEADEDTDQDDEALDDDQEDDATEEIELEAAQLAEYLGIESDGVDVNDDGDLVLKTKIDGKDGTATLAELLKSYQLEGHVNAKSMQQAERQKAWEQQATAAQTQIKTTLQQAGALLQHQETELLTDYNAIDWNTLEHADPGLYAATKQKMQERYQQIESIKGQVGQQSQVMQQQDFVKLMQRESVALMDALPEWKDEKVRTSEHKKIAEFLIDRGYAANEIYPQRDDKGNFTSIGIADHKAMMIARDAMLYRDLMAKKTGKEEIAKKKVRKKPKVLRAGAKKTKGQMNTELQGKKVQRLRRRGGNVQDLASVLEDRM